MRRKVIIDGRLIGYRHGGIGNYARQIAGQVPGIAAEMEFQVLTRHDIPCLSDRSRHALTPPHHRLEPYSLGLELLPRSVDIFHATDYVLPILPGARTVVTVHDLAFMSQPELLTSDSLRFYRRVADSVQRADRVIAVSEWTRGQITELLNVPDERVRVIPNGVDPTVFHTDSRGDRLRLQRLHPDLLQQIESGRPVVLAVATIEPRKRLGILIDAFARLNQQDNDGASSAPLLVIAGQAGWLADREIERLRALQRQNRARWIRDSDDRELAALYRSAKLLVMPSADEGFGLPVLEAMACGTPALAASTGALPELVSDSGFLEESDDPDRWARKIMAILNDDEIRTRRARRGVERAAAFTWHETAKQTVETYREVLDQR